MKDANDDSPNAKVIISENSKELAEKIKKISAEILEQNKELYKRLENK